MPSSQLEREENASRLVVPRRIRRGTGVLTPWLHDIVALSSSLAAVAFVARIIGYKGEGPPVQLQTSLR